MTPKQKAIEMYTKLRRVIRNKNLNDTSSLKEKSKKAAIICADEVLNSYEPHDPKDYWNQVKIEIEKL